MLCTSTKVTTQIQVGTVSLVNVHPKAKTENATSPSKCKVTIDANGDDFYVPDYSINDVLNAIPKKCFESSLWTSFSYVFRDIFFMIIFAYASNYIQYVPYLNIRILLWTIYVNLIALPMTGLWILAHECGHGAFSKFTWVNDITGWILHSYSLNPYFSWKASHRKHHKYNGHLRKDMAFVPPTTEEWKMRRGIKLLSEITEDSPIASMSTLLIQQVAGFQAYLLTDATGQRHPELEGKWWHQFLASHLNPTAPLFDKSDFWYIIVSDIGIVAQLIICHLWVHNFGWFNFTVHWLIPYILVNHWIVFITFLQHTDIRVPRYDSNQWTFARGAGATIDRDFGFVGEFFFHDLIETHVIHHYCGRIPFYQARMATEAIKPVLGVHYLRSDENMFLMLWKAIRWCEFVEGDDGVMMFRNHNGEGVMPQG